MKPGSWISKQLDALSGWLPEPEDRRVWLVCFGISLTFWLFVKLDRPYTTMLPVRITWQLPDSLAWRELPPSAMSVEVAGEGWDLLAQSLWRSDPVLFFPVGRRSNNTIGRDEIIAQLESQLHPNVDIVRLEHDFILLEVERRLVRRVPVKVRMQAFSLAPGYVLVDSIQVVPDTVEVSGPASLVQTIAYCETAPLEALSVSAPLVRTLPIELPDPHLLSVHPESVEVQVQVERITEKALMQPIMVLGDTARIRIQPTHVRLVFELPVSKYDMVDTTAFAVVADLRGLAPGSNQTTLPLHLMQSPPYVRNVRFTPQAVTFFFVEE